MKSHVDLKKDLEIALANQIALQQKLQEAQRQFQQEREEYQRQTQAKEDELKQVKEENE